MGGVFFFGRFWPFFSVIWEGGTAQPCATRAEAAVSGPHTSRESCSLNARAVFAGYTRELVVRSKESGGFSSRAGDPERPEHTGVSFFCGTGPTRLEGGVYFGGLVRPQWLLGR